MRRFFPRRWKRGFLWNGESWMDATIPLETTHGGEGLNVGSGGRKRPENTQVSGLGNVMEDVTILLREKF